ncbi:restriction endonuclease [uncultured Methanobrevibacter sp.]|uniref:restriction endonuclease n=1 Tax=uncultured Methanobrevibacter sp. TaxID=253161 RepID=UPI0025EE308C|nr:restriction endonuclease [uncultured Methanobrevibacter sp.]
MEKPQLVNFIAKVMEDSGFKVYKDFKTSKTVVDIYAILPSQMGDFGVVVACKNYDKQWEVGIDILKEMEMAQRSLQASKITVVTTSTFSPQAVNYASRKNIKLVDRDKLIVLAKKYAQNKKLKDNQNEDDDEYYSNYYEDSYYENEYLSSFSSYPEYDGYIDLYDDAYYENLALSSYNQQDMYYSPYVNNARADLHRSSMIEHQEPKPSRFSFLKRFKSNNKKDIQRRPPMPQRQLGNPNLANYNNLSSPRYETPKPSFNYGKILSNPIVLILLVVMISYLIAYVLGVLGRVKSGIIGLLEMLVSLILSYGLVYFFEKDGATVLIKGTIVFFISLVVLIGLILFL